MEERIKQLEADGEIDPSCKTCKEIFYPYLAMWSSDSFCWPFAPRHKPSRRCESGKHSHCTCDVCF
jgi:hypothetical protein